MTNTYNISLSASGVSETYTLPEQTYQGTTKLYFNFENVSESAYKVIKTVIDFGDNTYVLTQQPKIINTYADSSQTLEIAENGLTNFALSEVNHTYYSTNSAYFTRYNAIINITYSNFAQSTVNIPIRIAQTSFFSEYFELELVGTQFVAVSTNDVYAILASKDSSMYNLVIK